MPSAVKNNWRDVTIALSVASAIVTVVLFVAPLKTLPEDVRQVRDTQIAQTEILKSLSTASGEIKELRRDVDRNTGKIEHLEQEIHRSK